MTKKHVRNDGNYFTDAELMHRLAPHRLNDQLTLSTNCDKSTEGIGFFAGAGAAFVDRAPKSLR